MALLDLNPAVADSYIYGYPLVLGSVGSQGLKDRRNAFFTVNDDELRHALGQGGQILSMAAWLDLSVEPIVLILPEGRRYCAVSLFDGWCNSLQSVGFRITEGSYGTVVFSRSNGKPLNAPRHCMRITAPGTLARIVVRIAQYSESDALSAKAFQRGFALLPLSRYSNREPATQQLPDTGYSQTDIVRLVDAMSAAQFFGLMQKELLDNPPAPTDNEARRIVDSVLSISLQDSGVLEHGAHIGKSRIKSYRAKGMQIGAWSLDFTCEPTGPRDYLRRAAVARARVDTDDPQDYVRLITRCDERGEPLNGNLHYSLTFYCNAEPPARAPWMIGTRPTLRASGGQIERNADGTIVLHFCQNRPANLPDTQFFPVPAGPFAVVLHVFWPMEAILNGGWLPPNLQLAR